MSVHDATGDGRDFLAWILTAAERWPLVSTYRSAAGLLVEYRGPLNQPRVSHPAHLLRCLSVDGRYTFDTAMTDKLVRGAGEHFAQTVLARLENTPPPLRHGQA